MRSSVMVNHCIEVKHRDFSQRTEQFLFFRQNMNEYTKNSVVAIMS